MPSQQTKGPATRNDFVNDIVDDARADAIFATLKTIVDDGSLRVAGPLDTRICDIDPSPEKYDRFVKVIHATARKHIPRGCRKDYVSGLTTDLAEQYNEYIQLYEQDPFSADTITAGDELA